MQCLQFEVGAFCSLQISLELTVVLVSVVGFCTRQLVCQIVNGQEKTQVFDFVTCYNIRTEKGYQFDASLIALQVNMIDASNASANHMRK